MALTSDFLYVAPQHGMPLKTTADNFPLVQLSLFAFQRLRKSFLRSELSFLNIID